MTHFGSELQTERSLDPAADVDVSHPLLAVRVIHHHSLVFSDVSLSTHSFVIAPDFVPLILVDVVIDAFRRPSVVVASSSPYFLVCVVVASFQFL